MLLRARRRLALSGTPLENRLLDLWSLMTFATPGALGDRNYFHRNFDRRKDAKASERLAARLRPFRSRLRPYRKWWPHLLPRLHRHPHPKRRARWPSAGPV